MYRRLKILIPLLQAAAFVSVFGLKLVVDRGGIRPKIVIMQELASALNFPIFAVFRTLVYSSRVLPDSWGWLSEALGWGFAILLIPSVALLWYVVVLEFELRSQGKSAIRFSNSVKELASVVLMFLFGGRALYEAFIFHSSLIDTSLYRGLPRVAEMANKFILITWGVVLVGIAVYDLASYICGMKAKGRRDTFRR